MNETTFTMEQMRAIVAYENAKRSETSETSDDVENLKATPREVPDLIGAYVIVRGDRSGVFFGVVESLNPATNEVILADVRHIWRWEGSANTAELAAHGVAKPDGCKFVGAGRIMIWDAIEVIPCSVRAIGSLLAVPWWEECP